MSRQTSELALEEQSAQQLEKLFALYNDDELLLFMHDLGDGMRYKTQSSDDEKAKLKLDTTTDKKNSEHTRLALKFQGELKDFIKKEQKSDGDNQAVQEIRENLANASNDLDLVRPVIKKYYQKILSKDEKSRRARLKSSQPEYKIGGECASAIADFISKKAKDYYAEIQKKPWTTSQKVMVTTIPTGALLTVAGTLLKAGIISSPFPPLALGLWALGGLVLAIGLIAAAWQSPRVQAKMRSCCSFSCFSDSTGTGRGAEAAVSDTDGLKK